MVQTLEATKCGADLIKDEASSSGIKYRSPETIQETRGKNQHQIRIHRATMPKRHRRRKSPVKESGRGGSKNIPSLSNERSPDWKTKSYKGTHQIPMLSFENIALDKTPNREMPSKKRYNVVNVVDINCGSSSGSLANRLKKLGFSKLSQSFV
ncbi:hypothetical protein Nepgr_007566 [Nepenthes gracilis]|uniref:Uncharacterized protein n=1 Tax=Nepenthes gracilis TaxID=150966 RepID=A0AAD3S7H0_NEPGR|nr:hypothetical protein Nepgr_007566 [Nepenthes gracilis]